jgi:thioredoxin reductase
VHVFKNGTTSVPGIHVAGDISSRHQFVATAVAQGVEAAVAIHESLFAEAARADRPIRRRRWARDR